ncbi:PLP-dependent aminotransferase family protein [Zavarzinia compransoris]|uniref:aminotransferase-like domain-containing protein n=1 Tax=Zavarzinia marina TaxID=2911065 RepID=UPI001F451D09|nr:PLP-dependent aminotransferase family protein [Zavarzinia marina]MCF4165101.1 PLP-dependent aminotransferase family protein [Zavarzinia marina]
MNASEIRELLKLLDQPDIISYAGGIPDPAQFPTEAFGRAYAEIMADPVKSAQALQYSVSEGYSPLRCWIAGQMAALGVACDESNILITAGSQQALDFIGKLFLSPGDTALVTAPTYLGALQAFSAYEPSYDTLALDGNRTPDSYREAAAAKGGRVGLAYLVPDFSNPSGETVPLSAREAVLDLADALNVPVIEDAAYQALRYDGEAVPPILAIEAARRGGIEHCRTLYCGTFSKTLAPALRIGWVCGASAAIAKLVLAKQAADLHCATINQMVMHRVAEECYAAQVASNRAVYRVRRDAMLAALERHMPPGVSWTRPEGGMFVWVGLPAGLNGAEVLARAVAECRVAFVPGGAFYGEGRRDDRLRLSFSLSSPRQIDEGIARLGSLIARMAGGG